MHTPYAIVWILQTIGLQEGTLSMSSSVDKTGVELIIIITWKCRIKNKSQRVGGDSKGMQTETPFTALSFQNLLHFNYFNDCHAPRVCCKYMSKIWF